MTKAIDYWSGVLPLIGQTSCTWDGELHLPFQSSSGVIKRVFVKFVRQSTTFRQIV